jgi:serine/threonine-protein kinase
MPTPAWDLSLFGGVGLHGPDTAAVERVLVQPKHVALLAYLTVEGDAPRGRRYHRRDHLVGLLWPELDQEHARASLRRVVFQIRGALGADVVVSRGDDELAVDETRVSCDVVAFTRAIADDRLAAALELYRGDLMPGFFLDECTQFQDWVDGRRIELRRDAGAAAWTLAQMLEGNGQLTVAGKWARRAAEFSRDDERMIRRAMTMLERLSDRSGALHVYDEFVKWLRREREASPAPETDALAARIRGEGR